MRIRHRLNLIFHYGQALAKWPIYGFLGKIGASLIKLNSTRTLEIFFSGTRTKYLGIRLMVPTRDIQLTDEAKEKINETTLFLHEVVNQNFEVQNTSEYRKMKKSMELGYLPKGFSTELEVRNYFYDLLRVYESIDKYGFRIILKTKLTDLKQASNIHLISLLPIPHEIIVQIDSTGAAGWLKQGLHRQAIAKFLAIDSIPVYVWSCDRSLLSFIVRQRVQGTKSDSTLK
jgi:hypothetical protein